MAVGIVFQYASEFVEVRIIDTQVLFRTSQTGSMFATIDNLKLSRDGVMKEFPDLSNNPLWKEEGIKRFKEKIMSFRTEDERVNYIIEDLKKHGYVPRHKQRTGWRAVRL